MRTPLTGDVRSGIHLSLETRSFIIARFASGQSETMPDTHLTRLDEPLWPLMNKFYRAHQSSMRAVRDAQLWVARRDEIVGGLCLRPVAGGHWLTGLFVDPACREQGVAAALITAAVKTCELPVWLFCHPDLRGFYERLGFTFDPPMPYAMVERLGRYARSKPMIAMGLEPLVRSSDHNV
jgi:GNAT superfamily N-acetyltransferase